jgi:hypothetical protein
MNAEPIKLRFVHRFQNGTLCTLTFQLIDGVPRPHHLWSGPLPKFKGEPPRLAATCASHAVNHSRRPSVCLPGGRRHHDGEDQL